MENEGNIMVVLSPKFELTVGKYNVHAITGAVVKMSRKKPVDVCYLEFPNHKAFTIDVFAENDLVDLSLGFAEFAIAPVFNGTITDIEPNFPLRVKSENVGQGAKQIPYKKIYENATWCDVAKDALARGGMRPQTPVCRPPTKPPAKYRVNNLTPAEVLNNITEETGFIWYAIPGTQDGYCGPPQESTQRAKPFIFTVGTNVYADKCDLEFIKARRIKKVTVVLPDADALLPTAIGVFKATDYEKGNKEVTLHKNPIPKPTDAIAEQVAAQEYSRLSSASFIGSFWAVGNPYIHQDSLIALRVPNYDDNTRHVYVESVNHHFGDCRYEMYVTLAGE